MITYPDIWSMEMVELHFIRIVSFILMSQINTQTPKYTAYRPTVGTQNRAHRRAFIRHLFAILDITHLEFTETKLST